MFELNEIQEALRQIDSATFQKLCDEYLIKKGQQGTLIPLGSEDGKTKTTAGTPDTYFLENDEYTLVEYTTQMKGLKNKIRDDIKKIKELDIPKSKIKGVYYFSNNSNITPENIEELKKLIAPIPLRFFSNDDLAIDIKNKYRSLANEYLHLKLQPLEIKSPKEFEVEYNNQLNGTKLNSFFDYRKEELDQINKAFQKNKTILLVGKSGVGKTKLAYEYAKKQEDKDVYFITPNSTKNLTLQFSKALEDNSKKLFIFDDANRIEQLLDILKQFTIQLKNQNIKILITIRDYAKEKIIEELNEYTNFTIIKVKDLQIDQIKQCVSAIYDINNKEFLDRIIEISQGNIRLAMLAGKAYLDGDIENIVDASTLYESLVSDLLKNLNIRNNRELAKILGAIAFLQKFDIRSKKIDPILKISGLSNEKFRDIIYKLDNLEIIDFIDERYVKFSDQNLELYFLKYVFLDHQLLPLDKIINAYFDSDYKLVYEAIQSLLNVFSSEKSRTILKEIIEKSWNYFESKDSILDFATKFVQFDPEKAVALAYAEIMVDDKSYFNSKKNNILNLIGSISNTTEFEYSSELMVKYIERKETDILDIVNEINKKWIININTIKRENFKKQISLFSSLVSLADKNNKFAIVVLKCIPNFLKFQYSQEKLVFRDDSKFEIENITIVKNQYLFEFRKILWTFLIQLTKNNSRYNSEIKNIINNYGRGVTTDNKKELETVVHFDAPYISNIISTVFLSESLSDCIEVHRIKKFFNIFDTNIEKFLDFENNPDLPLYLLMTTSDEEKDKKINGIFMDKSNKVNTFERMCNVGNNAIVNGKGNWKICESIEMALDFMKNYKNDYFKCVEIIFNRKYDFLYSILAIIITNLIEISSNNEVLSFFEKFRFDSLLLDSCYYLFYSSLPQNKIDHRILKNLKSFLKNEELKDTIKLNNRSVYFLIKYKKLDKNVVKDCCRIIYSKQEQFKELYLNIPSILNLTQINQWIISVGDNQINQYIYLNSLKQYKDFDYFGIYLYSLYKKDNSILIEYYKKKLVKDLKEYTIENNIQLVPLIKSSDCNKILNILKEKILSSNNKILFINFIKYLGKLEVKNEDIEKNIDQWLTKLINDEFKNENLIYYIFNGLVYCGPKIFTKYEKIYFLNMPKDCSNLPPISSYEVYDFTEKGIKSHFNEIIDALKDLSDFLKEKGLEYLKYKNEIDKQIKNEKNYMKEELNRQKIDF